jgi:hypothetical protein
MARRFEIRDILREYVEEIVRIRTRPLPPLPPRTITARRYFDEFCGAYRQLVRDLAIEPYRRLGVLMMGIIAFDIDWAEREKRVCRIWYRYIVDEMSRLYPGSIVIVVGTSRGAHIIVLPKRVEIVFHIPDPDAIRERRYSEKVVRIYGEPLISITALTQALDREVRRAEEGLRIAHQEFRVTCVGTRLPENIAELCFRWLRVLSRGWRRLNNIRRRMRTMIERSIRGETGDVEINPFNIRELAYLHMIYQLKACGNPRTPFQRALCRCVDTLHLEMSMAQGGTVLRSSSKQGSDLDLRVRRVFQGGRESQELLEYFRYCCTG